MKKFFFAAIIVLAVSGVSYAGAIKFSGLANYSSLTFTTYPTYPKAPTPQGNVSEVRTAGNQSYRYYTGLESTEWTLTWGNANCLTADEYSKGWSWSTRTQDRGQSLVGWVIKAAQYGKNTFTFTDEQGNTHTVYILDDALNFKQQSTKYYTGSITLREEH